MWSCAFLMGKRDERVYIVIQKSLGWLQGYTHVIQDSKV
jgi:hypothetical protein